MYYYALILLAINVIIFLIQFLIPGFTDFFVLASAKVLYRPWTLFTSMFLHGDISHLFYNMFALGLFGTILEKIIGNKRFLMIYFSAGLLSAIGSVFKYDAALGASGAIFGIMGALAVLRPKLQVWISYMPMPMIVAAFVWTIGNIIGMFAPNNVANLAHLIGLFFGVGCGFYLRKDFKKENNHIERADLSEEEIREWENRYLK